MQTRTALFVAVISASLVLAACGDAADEPGPDQEPQESAEAQEGGETGESDNGAADELEAEGESAGDCTELETVRLAVPAPSLNFVPYYLGEAEGIFEEHCIDLDIEVLSGDVAIAALLSDEIDFTAAGGTAMRAANEGAPLTTVMVTVAESTASLVVDPTIESPQDIEGADIGVLGTGDSLAVALGEWLSSEGLDIERDVNLLTLNSTPDAFSSLVGGGVDAAMLTPPFDAQAEAEGFEVLVRVSEFFAGSQGQIATTTDKVENNPEFVERFLHAALDSIELMIADPEATQDFVVEFLEMDPDIAARSLEVFTPALAADGTASVDALLSQLPDGATEENVDAVTDFSLLERVNAERG